MNRAIIAFLMSNTSVWCSDVPRNILHEQRIKKMPD